MALADARVRAVGYVRVSTQEQGQTGAGLAAQRHTIAAAAELRGWALVSVEEDAAASGKSMARRPGLARAIDQIESKQADVLVVSKLDRLSRSVVDFGTLLERSRTRGWGLVALDLGVDTTTAAGELVANVMVSVAQWERRAIGDRTREGLAARRAEGVVLGRPRAVVPEVAAKIAAQRASGMTLAAIARDLNLQAVPTAHGGRQWWPSTVKSILDATVADPQ